MKLKRASLILAALMAFILILSSPSFAAAQWKQLTSTYPGPKPLSQIKMTSLTTGCATGYDGNFWKTTDGGNSWTRVQAETSNHQITRLRFSPTDSNVAYAVASPGPYSAPGYLYKTTDNGSSWGAPVKTFTDANIYSVYALNDDRLWVTGKTLEAGSELGRSINGGTDWTYFDAISGNGTVLDVWFTDTSNGVIFAGDGIYHTATGEGGWTVGYAPGEGVDIYCFGFADSTTGWGVGDDDGVSLIAKTTDSGASWETQVLSGNGILTDVSAIDGSNCWTVGYNRIVLRTTDGGSNWALAVDGLPTATDEVFGGVHFLDEYNGWIAGIDSVGTMNPIIYKWVVDPTVASIVQTGTSISDIPQGFSGNVDISGTNLNTTTSVSAGAGVTINSVTPTGSSAQGKGYSYPTLRVNLTVSSTASAGARDLTVSNLDTGIVTYSAFAVTNAPTISSISPGTAYQGWSNTITITGANFVSGAAVSLGSDIDVLSTTVTATQILVIVNISSTASAGARSLTVTNPDNGVGTTTFEVLAVSPVDAPSISNIYFDLEPYYSTGSTPTPEVGARPTVKFDFAAPNGVSVEGFRIYVATAGATSNVTTYLLPSSVYSGNTASGIVSYQLPLGLAPGHSVLTLYGQDADGAGVSQVCNVQYVDPTTVTATIVNALPYPSLWSPAKGAIDFDVVSNVQVDNCRFLIIGHTGSRLYVRGPLTLYPGHNKIGRWDGYYNGGSSRVPEGLYLIVIESGGNSTPAGKFGVSYGVGR